MIDDLYSAQILKLTAHIPHIGRLVAPTGTAERMAKLCGSRIIVDVVVVDGVITDFAQEVKACALGQAAASILGAHVIGATVAEVVTARDALVAMLKADGEPPQGRFADLATLRTVRDFPARHASTALAFEAVVAACGQ
jgi:NifU-like protein involved in Fe-S cluster formation